MHLSRPGGCKVWLGLARGFLLGGLQALSQLELSRPDGCKVWIWIWLEAFSFFDYTKALSFWASGFSTRQEAKALEGLELGTPAHSGSRARWPKLGRAGPWESMARSLGGLGGSCPGSKKRNVTHPKTTTGYRSCLRHWNFVASRRASGSGAASPAGFGAFALLDGPGRTQFRTLFLVDSRLRVGD